MTCDVVLMVLVFDVVGMHVDGARDEQQEHTSEMYTSLHLLHAAVKGSYVWHM